MPSPLNTPALILPSSSFVGFLVTKFIAPEKVLIPKRGELKPLLTWILSRLKVVKFDKSIYPSYGTFIAIPSTKTGECLGLKPLIDRDCSPLCP